MNLFLWGVTVLSIIGVTLNVKKKRSCFAIWTVTNLIWAIHNFRITEYAQSVSYLVYLGFAIWGFIAWRE